MLAINFLDLNNRNIIKANYQAFIFLLFFGNLNYCQSQFQHSVEIGFHRSIIEERLYFEQSSESIKYPYYGPEYDFSYNLGYGFNYRLKSEYSISSGVRFYKMITKLAGSGKFPESTHSYPYDTIYDSWTTYFSLPIFVNYYATSMFNYTLGWSVDRKSINIDSRFLNNSSTYFNTTSWGWNHFLIIGCGIKVNNFLTLNVRWYESLKLFHSHSIGEFDVKFKARRFEMVLQYHFKNRKK